MSPADQVTVTYIVVGIAVGLISWLATGTRGSAALIVNLAAAVAGAFGVEILLHRVFGIYATFGSLDNLIGTSIVKSGSGAILTVALLRLVLHFARPKGGARARG